MGLGSQARIPTSREFELVRRREHRGVFADNKKTSNSFFKTHTSCPHSSTTENTHEARSQQTPALRADATKIARRFQTSPVSISFVHTLNRPPRCSGRRRRRRPGAHRPAYRPAAKREGRGEERQTHESKENVHNRLLLFCALCGLSRLPCRPACRPCRRRRPASRATA